MVRELHVRKRRRGGGFQDVAVLTGFLALTLGVGVFAGLVAEPNALTWYPTLAKPLFNPPNWVFAPVWTVLYVLMAVAGWRVWRITDFESRALLFWVAQLALNFAWPFIFFGVHAIGLALIEIAALWFLVLLTMVAFLRVDRIAGWLFAPYLAWLSFAAALNAAIHQLNPG
ncbi:MAG: tryptophan-rich sensory protein [Proteobacteria bacterium]|nr:tryptophan-rich sensory protein [Pseudomonadota bacterium]